MRWPIWRLVLDGIATLQELETHWSLDDLLRANDALDLRQEADAAHKAAEEAKRRQP